VIDLHTHLLPGLDDGTTSLDEACELAALLVRDGVATAAVTPHVREDYPTTSGDVEAGLAALRRALHERAVPLSLVSGAEVALEYATALDRAELVRLSYGGRGRHLLVEFPYSEWPLELNQVVGRLLSLGLVPVLAHPERNGAVQQQPVRLREVVASGALVQLTASSLLGILGRSARACGRELLSRGLAHMLASDVHDIRSREVGLSRAAASLHDDLLASWLTRGAPSAIVAGTQLPPRRQGRRRSLAARLRGGAQEDPG
jgi:protein-tyrosine phosphatase